MSALPEQPAGTPYVARSNPRLAVDAEVTMRRSGKLSFRVHVYDLSLDGCKAEFVDRPELHEHLWIKFDSLDALEARVCWIGGTKVGLRFERPIYEPVFAALTTRFGQAGDR